jgi:hypothetical protein
MKKSIIKLDGGNNCPEKDSFYETMSRWGIKFKVVNLENKRYWENESDTAVFMVSKKTTFNQMLNLISAIHDLRPDECSSELSKKGNAVFRLWWD